MSETSVASDRYPGDEVRRAIDPARGTRRRHLCGCLTVWDNEREESVAEYRCTFHRPQQIDREQR